MCGPTSARIACGRKIALVAFGHVSTTIAYCIFGRWGAWSVAPSQLSALGYTSLPLHQALP